jgi:hypothetical protein
LLALDHGVNGLVQPLGVGAYIAAIVRQAQASGGIPLPKSTQSTARPYFPPSPIDREITSFMISLVPP